MKTTLAAAVVALAPAFALAQQTCIPYEQLQEQWSSINTNQVFQGLSDRGALVQAFENPDNGRFSIWIIPPTQPRIACLADQGSAADSTHSPFTVATPATPESSL